MINIKKEIRIINKFGILFFLMFLGSIFIILGIELNSIVIHNNQNKMPVLSEINFNTTEHFSYQNKSEIKYYYLSDIIYIFGSIWSIGDFLMLIFSYFTICLFLIFLILRIEEIRNKKV